jgi:hypothetical protein
MAADTPSAYTAGTLSLGAGTVYNLATLVQTQIDKNAALAAFQVMIQADAGNSAPILFGSTAQTGSGSPTQYGYSLAAGSDRFFGGGTGNNVLYGRWYVTCSAAALLHIEIFP